MLFCAKSASGSNSPSCCWAFWFWAFWGSFAQGREKAASDVSDTSSSAPLSPSRYGIVQTWYPWLPPETSAPLDLVASSSKLASMSGCAIDLIIARHLENISWAESLGRQGLACLHVYRTGRAAESNEIPVPNTGREALCFALHIERVLSGRVSIFIYTV